MAGATFGGNLATSNICCTFIPRYWPSQEGFLRFTGVPKISTVSYRPHRLRGAPSLLFNVYHSGQENEDLFTAPTRLHA
jgi:hypothetical protein